MKTAAGAAGADILRIKYPAVATFGILAGFDGDSLPNHSPQLHSNHSFIPTETGPGVVRPVHGCRSEFVGVVRAHGAYRLIAVRRIAAGTRLFRIEGEQTRRPTRYSVQIGENLHIDLSGGHSSEEILDRYYWRFMNHSCEPNTHVRGQEVIASHAIEPWEDVTFNYNTTEFDLAEPFDCHCGSPGCFGTIRGFKHLTADERERMQPMLAPYLSRLLSPCAEFAPR